MGNLGKYLIENGILFEFVEVDCVNTIHINTTGLNANQIGGIQQQIGAYQLTQTNDITVTA